jgi:hypothetical protein
MKQHTINNNKNENMKMRKILITALVLGACVGTQAFAQNTKQDTITFALTVQQQSSVSTSTALNAGNWSQGPQYYKTATTKLTQADILKAIAYVLHNNAGFYSSKASLQLVQGELGGFWNIYDSLAQSYEDFDQYPLPGNVYIPGVGTTAIPANLLTGSFNDWGQDNNFYQMGTGWPLVDAFGNSFGPGAENSGVTASDYPVFYPGISNSVAGVWIPYLSMYYVGLYDGTQGANGDFATSLDTYDRTSISDGTDEYTRLATGRHFLPVPWADYTTDTTLATTGEYPPGHMQPWGQIYVKDPGATGYSVTDPLCENVTFFFYLSVQECYDCFYLNSFISDATFKSQQGNQGGPPCCTTPSFLLGKGTDRYYLSLSFDNTINNSFLNDVLYTNNYGQVSYYYEFTGYRGLTPTVGVADGTTPDLLLYSDPIRSGLGTSSKYEMRFTLNGIVTYTWNLEMVNKSDVAADFVGTASYSANGYGFIGLVCSLINGSATFSEKIVKDIGCCDDYSWYLAVPQINVNNLALTHANGWYGPGSDDLTGYYNPANDSYENYLTYYNFYVTDPYPYYNVIAGWSYPGAYLNTHQNVFPQYNFTMPDQNESPLNPPAALTQHGIVDKSATRH